MKNIQRKNIPVSKHVKKFLNYYFPEPYTLMPGDFLGTIFIVLFKKGYRTSVVKKAEACFQINVKKNYLQRFGRVIPWENAVAFNKAIDDIFRKQLFNYMDLNRKLDKDFAKTSMVQFLEEMNITEDDINYDSLYREYKRKKNYPKTSFEMMGETIKKKIKNKMTDLSPKSDRFVP
ncbi:conserved hypothetical protein [Tenacibaculum sp. 190524A02b]|uniref:Uncharacterized protein n=1 Tax=Tenacibaculum vairaonense TaxID=3137860 RepID=A0ABM9PIQ7_9FLAO